MTEVILLSFLLKSITYRNESFRFFRKKKCQRQNILVWAKDFNYFKFKFHLTSKTRWFFDAYRKYSKLFF